MPAPVVAIVGAGQAGFQAAASLRQERLCRPRRADRRRAGSALPAPAAVEILPRRRIRASMICGCGPPSFTPSSRSTSICGDAGNGDRPQPAPPAPGSGDRDRVGPSRLATGARLPAARRARRRTRRRAAAAHPRRCRCAAAAAGRGARSRRRRRRLYRPRIRRGRARAAAPMVHIIEVTHHPMGRVVSAPISRFFTEAHIALGRRGLARHRGRPHPRRRRPGHRGRDDRRPASSPPISS